MNLLESKLDFQKVSKNLTFLPEFPTCIAQIIISGYDKRRENRVKENHEVD